MREIIEPVFVVLGGAISITMLIALTVEGKWREFYLLFLIPLCFHIIGLYLTYDSNNQKELLLQKEEQIWKSKGCPVYKTECGGKHKYTCERKAAVIGRNQVGDMFVEAYGICNLNK